MVVTATELSTVRVHFVYCNPDWNERLYVHVQNPQNKELCVFEFTRRRCSSTNKTSCTCVEESSDGWLAEMSKTVSKADEGIWVWLTGDGFKTEIQFDVQDPVSAEPTTAKSKVPPTEINSVLYDSSSKNTDGLDDGTTVEVTHVPTEEAISTDHSITTGLVFGGGNIAVVIAIVLVVFLCRKRHARRVNTRYTVNFTPVLEVNDDVLTWTNRHDTPDDVGRCTSYVSFGGIVAWSNENISQAFSNDAYLATSPSSDSNLASRTNDLP
ncbi:uncharacterized protein [Littorina saxatilis]|uniref:uncharacterized protein n=1 Tax=Littorina saxatilis TaxID=31220 RepID=UPI0038B43907